MQKVQQYLDIIEEVRAQFSPAYFSTEVLCSEIKKTEQEIKKILDEVTRRESIIARRNLIIQNPIIPHPKVKKHATFVKEQVVIDRISTKLNLRTLFPVNHCLKLQFYFEKMHLIKYNGDPVSDYVIKQFSEFRIHMHHGDQHSVTQKMYYDPSNNLHSGFNKQRIRYGRNFSTAVSHDLRESLFEAKINLLSDNQIRLFCQIKGNLILAESVLSLSQILENPQQIKDSFKARVLQFYQPCDQKGGQCLVMLLDTFVSITLSALPVEIEQLRRVEQRIAKKDSPLKDSPLKDSPLKASPLKASKIQISPDKKSNQRSLQKKGKIHSPKKKMISPSNKIRSTSPSPIAKKQLLKSLVFQKNQNVLQVFSGLILKVPIKWNLNVYENIEPVYQQVKNVKEKHIHIMNEGSIWVLEIKMVLQGEEEGQVRFSLQGKCKYLLKVVRDRSFRIFNQSQARKRVKELHSNCLIKMDERIYIYPSEKVRLQKNPIAQKIQRGLMNVNFIKSDYKQVVVRCIPYDLMYEAIRKEGGYMIYYKITRGPSSQSIAFSVKGLQSQFTEIHITDCEIREPDFKYVTNKELYVEKLGFYKLDMAGVVKENALNRITIEYGQKVVRLVNGDNFVYRNPEGKGVERNEYLILQLIKEIKQQCKLVLYVDDIDKRLTMLINLNIIPKPSNQFSSIKQIPEKEEKKTFQLTLLS